MSTTRLPELPAPDGFAMGYGADVFSRPRMHVYGLAVWKAAMQCAVELAESDEFYGNATQHLIAEALRSLPLPEQGGPQERREG